MAARTLPRPRKRKCRANIVGYSLLVIGGWWAALTSHLVNQHLITEPRSALCTPPFEDQAAGPGTHAVHETMAALGAAYFGLECSLWHNLYLIISLRLAKWSRSCLW